MRPCTFAIRTCMRDKVHHSVTTILLNNRGRRERVYYAIKNYLDSNRWILRITWLIDQ